MKFKDGLKLIDGSRLYKIGEDLFNIFSFGRIELITKATFVRVGNRIKLENKKYILVDGGQ